MEIPGIVVLRCPARSKLGLQSRIAGNEFVTSITGGPGYSGARLHTGLSDMDVTQECYSDEQGYSRIHKNTQKAFIGRRENGIINVTSSGVTPE